MSIDFTDTIAALRREREKLEASIAALEAKTPKVDRRAMTASKRLHRIHELANWAIAHGAEEELFGRNDK